MKNNINKGFTIVETMIVLAIAGLILLIVLLAVPALQRSSTNTNMKTDASAISAAISDFESNNGGMIPTTADLPTAPDTTTGKYVIGGQTGSTAISSTAKIQTSDIISPNTSSPAISTWDAAASSNNTIYISIGFGCDSTPNSRTVSIFYPVATGSGSNAQYSSSNCLE